MKKIIVLITLLTITSYAYTTTINIPDDYSTIQEGIDATIDGDTVLVDTGTYVENINFNGKNITVASLFFTTQDTSYISQTIIDGDSSDTVVTFENGEDTTAVLGGLTITNGYAHRSYPKDSGGGIYVSVNSSPRLNNLRIINNNADNSGGGIYFKHSSPLIENVTISCNNANRYGGGIYFTFSSPTLESVTITYNTAKYSGGGIMFHYLDTPQIFCSSNRCNIYSNTVEESRGFGTDIHARFCDVIIDIILDTFTVMTPTDYYASPIDNFTFDILHGVENNLINSDLYVSVDGNDSNSGTSPDEPFKTIKHALSKIYSDSMNVNTIHLAPGVYGINTNGENFPIRWSNYVNLSGSNQEDTILDGGFISRVLYFEAITNAIIDSLRITNGNSYTGGGILFANGSSPILRNVIIDLNSASGDGGGISCWYSSSPGLENVTVAENTAYNGGGIYCYDNSSPSLKNSIVSDNTGNYGIYVSSGNPAIEYSDFFNNENGNFYGGNPYLGVNVMTNANGDSCDAYFNIQEDPLFVEPASSNYHLTANSPCIDAGDPNSPLDPDGTVADMGAFYYNQGAGVGDEPEYITQNSFISYPNPITTTTNKLNISFSLKTPSKINVKLYNIKGQLVNEILNDNKPSGTHTISSNINNLASGIYFIKIDVDGNNRAVKKMVKIE